jgi:hypothetical protein
VLSLMAEEDSQLDLDAIEAEVSAMDLCKEVEVGPLEDATEELTDLDAWEGLDAMEMPLEEEEGGGGTSSFKSLGIVSAVESCTAVDSLAFCFTRLFVLSSSTSSSSSSSSSNTLDLATLLVSSLSEESMLVLAKEKTLEVLVFVEGPEVKTEAFFAPGVADAVGLALPVDLSVALDGVAVGVLRLAGDILSPTSSKLSEASSFSLDSSVVITLIRFSRVVRGLSTSMDWAVSAEKMDESAKEELLS